MGSVLDSLHYCKIGKRALEVHGCRMLGGCVHVSMSWELPSMVTELNAGLRYDPVFIWQSERSLRSALLPRTMPEPKDDLVRNSSQEALL